MDRRERMQSSQRFKLLVEALNSATFLYIQLIRIPTYKLTPEYGMLPSGSG